MPHSIVLPSSTRRATFCPIRRRTSSGSGERDLDHRLVVRHQHVDVVDVDEAVAVACGACRELTWAMTYLALAAAALTISTDTPRLHSPLTSGGVTEISATSIGMRPLSNSRGISDRKIGV